MTSKQNLDTLRERKHLLDDVWLLTVLVVLVAIAAPWYNRVVDIALGPVVWTAFAFGCFYLLISVVAERASSRLHFLSLLAVLQIGGVLVLALIWRLSGGVQNPALLVVFALPVIAGSTLCVRWYAYLTAFAGVLFVGSICLLDNPGLRWYLGQAGLPLAWFSRLSDSASVSVVHPFPGLSAPPAYIAMLIFVFGVTMFLSACVGETIGGAFERQQNRLSALADSLANAESLSTAVLRQSLWPSALIYADTFRFVQVSRSLLRQYFVKPDDLENQNFFDVVEFSYPDVVESLIKGAGGEVPLAVCSVRGEKTVTRVQVSLIDHAGMKYAYVSIQDITDSHYLRLALDTLEDPVVVVNPQGRLQCFNDAARGVLGGLEAGAAAAESLHASNLPFAWWDASTRSRQTRDVQLNGRTFDAKCAAARVVGEREPLTVISLHER